ncbi:MAG: hemolysin family protein [Desulfomonilaceae bacterium]
MWQWLKSKLRRDRGPTELQQVIEESEEKGLIDHEEGDMIEGIFELKQTVAREIMIPRTSIVAVPSNCTLEQLLSTIIESGHSRIPVYEENVDHIVGILNAKDLLPLWLENRRDLDLSAIAREPYFVPETKRINDLLKELRAKKSHLAIIVDEYGGTSGIVTIEDIIEEIIGEIRDEHDVEEEPFIVQDEAATLVSAVVNLDDFEERFEVSVPREGYDTLGGFIIHHLGRVPARGEELVVGDLRLQVHSADPKRITRVLVTRIAAQDEESIRDALGHDS